MDSDGPISSEGGLPDLDFDLEETEFDEQDDLTSDLQDLETELEDLTASVEDTEETFESEAVEILEEASDLIAEDVAENATAEIEETLVAAKEALVEAEEALAEIEPDTDFSADFDLDELEELPDFTTETAEEDVESGADQEIDLDKLAASDDEFDFLAGTDECATKLDLARAYLDMEDVDGAKELLQEVVAEGNDQQKTDARTLMDSIG